MNTTPTITDEQLLDLVGPFGGFAYTNTQAEPLRGWKMNHCQAHPEDEGVWEIGYLDAEDARFSPMLTIDTGLYYLADQAELLARSVLACLIAAAPKLEGGAA